MRGGGAVFGSGKGFGECNSQQILDATVWGSFLETMASEYCFTSSALGANIRAAASFHAGAGDQPAENAQCGIYAGNRG